MASPSASSTPLPSATLSAASTTFQRHLQVKGNKGRWDDRIPPLLRPLVRAYLIGYASAVGPRLLTLLIQHLTPHITGSRPKKYDDAQGDQKPRQKQVDQSFLLSVSRILKGGLEWQRFPTFCALLAGGSTLCEVRNKTQKVPNLVCQNFLRVIHVINHPLERPYH